MKSIRTIGFFGDSFCTEEYNPHSVWFKYETYIKQITKHYNAKIVNLGHGGSSIWDTILIQLKPFMDKKEFPDLCFFVWTSSGRLFNREVRRINYSDSLTPKLHTYNIFNYKIWGAAKQYYMYLHDHEQSELAHNAMLYYIDNVILPTFPKTTKIIHTWTSANPSDWSIEGLRPKKINYSHKWKHGVEIRPPLISLSLADKDISDLQTDMRPNHLDGIEKNLMLSTWIRYAIENYEDGKCIDYSDDVEKLWNR